MSYFDNNEFSAEERRNHAFQAINAIRESVTLAKGTTLPITYEHALDLIYDLDSSVYESITKLLTTKNESETVRYFKEMAEMQSTPEKKIEALDLIDAEISKHRKLIGNDLKSKRFIAKKIFELTAAKEYFTPREISEHKVLNQDFYLRSTKHFGEEIYSDDHFKDYKLSKNKYLRLRLLHPDKDEEVLGVDLVYEQFNMEHELARFAHLQYKMWNTNVLYFSQAKNLLPQLDKIEANLCKSGYCSGPKDENRDEYRFPYCSGFFRPTSKIANEDSKLISSGLHIPICQVREIQANDNKITKENCKEKSLSSQIFEELFNSNLIGSRWISLTELESFYEEKGLKSYTNRIRVHAQEVYLKTEEEKNINR